MKASVRVMKAAAFLALDWKCLSLAQIKIIECCRARVISRTLFSEQWISVHSGTCWILTGISPYWGRVGAVLSQGGTADGAPELAERLWYVSCLRCSPDKRLVSPPDSSWRSPRWRGPMGEFRARLMSPLHILEWTLSGWLGEQNLTCVQPLAEHK